MLEGLTFLVEFFGDFGDDFLFDTGDVGARDTEVFGDFFLGLAAAHGQSEAHG